MKLAVISDIHDNLLNLNKVLDFCQTQNIKEIICCGDIASSETLAKLSEYPGTINLVFGNMDLDYHKMEKLPITHSNLILHQGVGEVVLDNKNISFVHEPTEIEPYLAKVKIKPVIVFHGHTHKPWEQLINGVRVVNPGNVANMWYAPTFAVWDTQTNQLQLIMINQL